MLDAAAKQVIEELEDDRGYKFNNYVIEFPNGSRVNCMSSNPRRFRSKGGDVVLDEFAWHDQSREMLDAAMPTTTWGYDIRILSTHNGEESEFNRVIRLIKRVLGGELSFKEAKSLQWSFHRTPITVAVDHGLAEKVYKLKHIDKEARKRFLAECRARCRNEDAWNQEYMCIPSTALVALIPYDLYQGCEDPNCLQPLVPHTEGSRDYFLGGDIGREKHLTKLWVSELVGDIVITRKVVTLRKTPYHVQLQVISDLLSNQNIRRACIDATGIGDMLVESAQDRFGSYRVEKVKFTAPIKEHLASISLGRFQDRRCRVPADTQTRESFHSVRKTVTLAGNIRYDAAATDQGHADDFWAFALSCEAAQTIVVPECILL